MFNKKQCIENIYQIAKNKGVKIGDLEEKAGVSIGYLARLSKEGNNSSPSIETLLAFSDCLGVGITSLIDGNFVNLTKTEKIMKDFIEKMEQMTKKEQIEWKSIRIEEEDDYPLFYRLRYEDIDIKYDSYFSKEVNLDKERPLFYITILPVNKMRIIMIPMIYEESTNEVEIYTIKKGDLSPICSTGCVTKEIEIEIRKLYDMVAGKSIFDLDDEVRDGITNFLNDKPIIYDEEAFPFN